MKLKTLKKKKSVQGFWLGSIKKKRSVLAAFTLKSSRYPQSPLLNIFPARPVNKIITVLEIFATLKVKLKQSMIYKKCRLYCFEFGALAQGIIV